MSTYIKKPENYTIYYIELYEIFIATLPIYKIINIEWLPITLTIIYTINLIEIPKVNDKNNTKFGIYFVIKDITMIEKLQNIDIKIE